MSDREQQDLIEKTRVLCKRSQVTIEIAKEIVAEGREIQEKYKRVRAQTKPVLPLRQGTDQSGSA